MIPHSDHHCPRKSLITMRSLPLFGLLLVLLTGPLYANDWPQWRGPQRNGKIDSSIKFDQQTEFITKWTAEVGVGFSSMVIVDDLLVTMGHQDEQDRITCLNALTGEELWQHAYPAALDPNLFEGGPTATPAIAAGMVYTIGRQGLVHCLEILSGNVVWSYDIKQELKLNAPTWGFSGSPLVIDEKVILNAGAHGICLNARTGKLVWSSSNDIDAGYSSPVLIKGAETHVVVLLNAKEVNAVRVSDGELLWSERWITRYGINAADPLILNDHQILVSSGYGKGTGFIEFQNRESDLVWRNRDVRTQMSPGVLVNGAVYAIDGDADEAPALVCFIPQKGTPHWSVENFGAGTIMAVNSSILLLKESGELVIANANRVQFEQILSAKISVGKHWTPPVLVQNRLYVRNSAGRVTCSEVH